MDPSIKNSWDLRQEIIRLKGVEEEKSIALKARFSSPVAILSTIYSIFPKRDHTGEDRSNIFNQDFVSILSRFLVPLTLNKTLFKNSGFVIKTLVGLISQKASSYINEDSVVSLWDKAKSLVTNLTKKNSTTQENYPYGL